MLDFTDVCYSSKDFAMHDDCCAFIFTSQFWLQVLLKVMRFDQQVDLYLKRRNHKALTPISNFLEPYGIYNKE